mmetsp:Transcript_3202/g.5285  ORF Transcript_3202/g.5285 Transcript_3202/m.5285 type:complete len:482 (-) Transcript_3202:154-1599(-)
MFGKFAHGIQRAGRGSHGSKYRVEVEVISLDNVPDSISKCRLVWSRGVKISITDVRNVTTKGVAHFNQPLVQVITIYQGRNGSYESKEYEFKVQVPGKGSEFLTIGKAKLDMAVYISEETVSHDDNIRIPYRIGGNSSGILQFKVHSAFLAEADDGLTTVSGVTGITSEGTTVREQDLEGFDDDGFSVSNRRQNKAADTEGDGTGGGSSLWNARQRQFKKRGFLVGTQKDFSGGGGSTGTPTSSNSLPSHTAGNVGNPNHSDSNVSNSGSSTSPSGVVGGSLSSAFGGGTISSSRSAAVSTSRIKERLYSSGGNANSSPGTDSGSARSDGGGLASPPSSSSIITNANTSAGSNISNTFNTTAGSNNVPSSVLGKPPFSPSSTSWSPSSPSPSPSSAPASAAAAAAPPPLNQEISDPFSKRVKKAATPRVDPIKREAVSDLDPEDPNRRLKDEARGGHEREALERAGEGRGRGRGEERCCGY